MVAWINFAILLSSSLALLLFYVCSVSPAGLEKNIELRDAGEEAMRPKKDHVMYADIYTRIRHPQAVGEVFL
ncbi:MAG: hypothetical protein ABIF04_01505 [Chloroflexota bacterium]